MKTTSIIKKGFCLMLLIASLPFISLGQNRDAFVKQNPKIDTLLAMHKAVNTIDTLFPGYRIQIFFASGNFSKDKAQNETKDFEEKYNQPAYLSFKAPYYRVRVGNFRNALEATAFLKKIEREYPSAFIVEDMICFPSI